MLSKESWHNCAECNWRFMIRVLPKGAVYVYASVADDPYDPCNRVQSIYYPLPLGTLAIDPKGGLAIWKCWHCRCPVVLNYRPDFNVTSVIITDHMEMLKLLQKVWFFGELGELDWRPNETIPEDYYSF